MKKDIKTEDLVFHYTVQHLTLREIAALYSISATGIMKRLRKAGVTAKEGERHALKCSFCGADISRTRSQVKQGCKETYCNTTCYSAAITSPKSYIWRHGQRLARLIVRQLFDLQDGHVVHHVDGDNRNNDRNNLAVYASQGEHTRAHRGGKIKPLWTGV